MEWIGDFERVFAAVVYPNRLAFAAAAVLVVIATMVVARRQRWLRRAAQHPRRALALGIGLAIVGLPLVWYVGSPLVISRVIDEPAPVAAAVSMPPVVLVRPSASPSASQTHGATDSRSPAAADPLPTPSAEPSTRTGTFAGADEFHFGRGTAKLIETASGSFTLRLQDFEVRNGPDLFVYLSPAADGYVDGAIELGRLKADRGNQNYEVPAGIAIADVSSVVIWCKAFSVEFASAALS